MAIFSRGKPGESSSLNVGRGKNGQMHVSRKQSRRGREEDTERPSRRPTTSRASAYDYGKDSRTHRQEEALRIMREDYEARGGISQYETPAAPCKSEDKVKKWASEVVESSYSSPGYAIAPSPRPRPGRASPADDDDEDDSYEGRRPTRRAPARYDDDDEAELQRPTRRALARYDDDEDSPLSRGRPKARQQSYHDEEEEDDEEEKIEPRYKPLSFQTGEGGGGEGGGGGGGEQYAKSKSTAGPRLRRASTDSEDSDSHGGYHRGSGGGGGGSRYASRLSPRIVEIRPGWDDDSDWEEAFCQVQRAKLERGNR